MTLNPAVNNMQLVPRRPSSLPELRAADEGVASALEAVLSANTRRVYGTHWRLFEDWCGQLGLGSLPAEPLTVARYLAARAGSGASIATLRLAASAIAKAHEWAGHDSSCRHQGVRESLKGWGRRLAKPQRQAGALTADVLGVIRLTASQPRRLGRGLETPRQAAARARFDLALVSVLSDAGLRRSEAAVLTWGDVARWDDGSGRITAVRSKTDAEAQGGGRGHHARHYAGPGRRPAGGRQQRREGVRAVGFPDCPPGEGGVQGRGPGWLGEFSAGTAGGWAWPAAWLRTALLLTKSNARAAGSRAGGWWDVTPAVSRQGRR